MTSPPTAPDVIDRATKGPWHAEGPDMFGDFNILHPADSLAVAAVVSNLRPAEEVAANARLIESAPALAVRARDAEERVRVMTEALKMIEMLATEAPELNFSNFDMDEAFALNNKMIEIFGVVKASLASARKDACLSGYHPRALAIGGGTR